MGLYAEIPLHDFPALVYMKYAYNLSVLKGITVQFRSLLIVSFVLTIRYLGIVTRERGFPFVAC